MTEWFPELAIYNFLIAFVVYLSLCDKHTFTVD